MEFEFQTKMVMVYTHAHNTPPLHRAWQHVRSLTKRQGWRGQLRPFKALVPSHSAELLPPSWKHWHQTKSAAQLPLAPLAKRGDHGWLIRGASRAEVS